MGDLKSKAINSFIWKFLERFCAKIVSLIVSIILARLLFPEDYSVISIVFIFIEFADVFINGGLNMSLIHKKDSDEEDYSTVLITNVGIATIFYIALFFCAPLIANIYDNQLLIPLLRVMGLLFYINAFKSVICAYVSNNLDFKKFFFATIVGTVISGIIGIVLAMQGFGAWALVAQQLSNSFIDTILLFFTNKLRIKFVYSFTKLKGHFRFGWKLFISSLISTAFIESRPLIVGIKFTPTDLAFYNKGHTYPSIINSTIGSTLSGVMFPTLSKLNKNVNAVLAATRRFVKTATFIIFPTMLGFAVVSHNLVELLLTSKWLDIVPYMQIFCFTYMFNLIQVGGGQSINAMGRTDVTLIKEIVTKSLFFIIIVLFVFISPSPIIFAISNVACTVVSMSICVIANKKVLGYNYRYQLLDISINLIASIIMATIVYFVGILRMNTMLLLIIQVLVGIIAYVLINLLFKNSNLTYFYNTLKSILKRKKTKVEK